MSGFTGISCCDFSLLHEDVENRLGRSVWTHEFASKEFWQLLKDVYRKDFLEICYKEPPRRRRR